MKNNKPPKKWRSFYKEVVLPILIALILIQFVIQAFKIPTGSMEKSLLVGDFLLGLKFVYGIDLPWTEQRFLKLNNPKKDDVVIFRYPGDPRHPEYNQERYSFLLNLFLFGYLYWDHQENELVWYAPKDYIKRCVATSGDHIRLSRNQLWINDTLSPLPNKTFYQYSTDSVINIARDSLDFTLPKPGHLYHLDTLTLRDLLWVRSLAIQENPDSKIELSIDLLIDGAPLESFPFKETSLSLSQLKEIIKTGFLQIGKETAFLGTRHHYEYLHYYEVERIFKDLQVYYELRGKTLHFKPALKVNQNLQTTYQVKYPVYFMMGDNRDNSLDSRYWGMVSDLNIKAKAFITYFSLKEKSKVSLVNPFSWVYLPFDLRWGRIAQIIH